MSLIVRNYFYLQHHDSDHIFLSLQSIIRLDISLLNSIINFGPTVKHYAKQNSDNQLIADILSKSNGFKLKISKNKNFENLIK